MINKCVCGCVDFIYISTQFNFNLKKCSDCNIIIQDIDENEDIDKFYYEKYHTQSYTHSYELDYSIAEKRLSNYQFILNKLKSPVILDIGSGNSAFVDYLVNNGYEYTFGIEPGLQIKRNNVIRSNLLDYKPINQFDVITIHDVLEHFVDPTENMKKITALTKPNGYFILDFPNFFSNNGMHHWKRIEHIWCFNESQLISFVSSFGYILIKKIYPVDSKITLFFKRTSE